MSGPQSKEEIKAAIEHRDVLLAIRAILATASGPVFFKYLFKSLEVSEIPELGLEGSLLFERLGFLRAGKSIFKLVAEADVEIAGQLFAKVEKERQNEIYQVDAES